MNLANIFNFKYIWQNIKKSKAILILILLLFPVLSSCVILANKNTIITLSIMSILAYLGMVIPVILSHVCFGYVYKKKTVDFINSMPLSRKNIYFSNTLLGIGFIFILLIITILLNLLTAHFINSVLPFNVILDYFILWFVVYSFIFIVSNLAMSISGNEITTIIVSILLILFIPFMYDFATDLKIENQNTYIELDQKTVDKYLKDYKCYSTVCKENLKKNRYRLDNMSVKNSNSTNFLYRKFIEIFNYKYQRGIYIQSEINLMIVLSILYLILGYYSFKHRKMEVSETSFKSYKVHTLIKCLTLTPFMVLFMYILDMNEFALSTIVFLILILGYYYIYDLITKKGIQNFKKSILYFVIFTIFIFVITIPFISTKETDNVITLNDIDSISVSQYNFSINDIKDPEIIKFTIANNINQLNYSDGIVRYKVGNKYYLSSFESREYLDELSKLLDEKHLNNPMKEFTPSSSIAIIIDNEMYTKKDFKDIDKYSNNKENDINILYNIKFYYYDKYNHKIIVNDNGISDELINYLYNIHNQRNLNKIKKDNISINDSYIQIQKRDYNNTYWGDSSNIEKYLFDYFKNLNSAKIDLSKPYIKFHLLDYNSGHEYDIISNDIVSFDKYLKSKNIEDIFQKNGYEIYEDTIDVEYDYEY